MQDAPERQTQKRLRLRFDDIFPRPRFTYGHDRKCRQKRKRFGRIVEQIQGKYIAARENEVRTHA